MKKIIAVVLALFLMLGVSVADAPDLKEMSYNQLVALHRSIGREIMSRPEWKQVTVPTGTWYAGTDIPVGYYSIIATEDLSMVRLVTKDDDFIFYKTMSKDEVAGKVFFEAGSILTIYDPIILAPPLSLDF